ncbi:MAG: endonuclease III domain-containing protein, partial [Terriglobales bacterium]
PRPSGTAQTLRQYYQTLLGRLGPQAWWPARTRLEVILGAILVQNTSWNNAALAITRLREAGLLNLARLQGAPLARLEACVRPAGFYRQKTAAIRNFLAWLQRSCQGSLARLFARPAAETRPDLLSLKGLGPETVDAILLYAGRQPSFVADAYTRRILSRHGLVSPLAGYAQVQEFLHRHLPAGHALFNEFHALLVEVGKRFCKRQEPNCAACPLQEFLPRPNSAVAGADRAGQFARTLAANLE